MSATDDKHNRLSDPIDEADAIPAEAESSFDIEESDQEYVDKTKVMPQDAFEYVVPEETFEQHLRRKHRSTRKGTTKAATEEERKAAEEGFIFTSHKGRRKHRHKHKHRKWRHLAPWKRALIIVLCVILAVITAAAGAYLVLYEIGRHSMLDRADFAIDTPDADESGNDIIPVDNSGRVITYDGKTYELNDDLIYVTFIGTDEGKGEDEGLKMADAIYTFVLDTVTGETTVLGVSRDTMTDVEVFSAEGRFIDVERLQIAYSYAYGSAGITGGDNTRTSLSRLFYGLPFKDHFAIDMKALIVLNDAIGGVTLKSSITFTSPIDGRTISEGEEVTLHGKEADYYVRHRDKKKLDSNNDRMQRQQEYIRAFLASLIPAAKKDASLIRELYNEIKVNSDTTLSLADVTYIASTALQKLPSASKIKYVSLTGTITEGEYAELNVTNETAIRTMLDVFYKPLADVPDTTD